MAASDVQPYTFFAAITKSDTVDLPDGVCDAIYIGVAGDVAAIGRNNSAVTFKALPVGIHRLALRRVNSAVTAATDMVALYVR